MLISKSCNICIQFHGNIMRLRAISLAFLLGPVLSLQATAQNLLSNPGFETSLTGWTVSGGNGFPWGDTSSIVHTGTMGAVTACEDATCMDATTGSLLSQTIATTPGVTYSVSFSYLMPAAQSELQVLFGAAPLTSGGAGTCTGSCIYQTTTATPAGTWVQATATAVASGTATQLTFVGRSAPFLTGLDDVSVVAIPTPAAAVPVPTLSQWALIGMSALLAMFSFASIRRRK